MLEYDQLKAVKQQLHTLRLETSGEVPIGVRRPEVDHDFGDLFPTPQDPDKWPSPVAVDHSNASAR